jgi:hypothetical protein
VPLRLLLQSLRVLLLLLLLLLAAAPFQPQQQHRHSGVTPAVHS